MTIFGAIGVAGTGLTVYRKWIDAISDNLANVNTVRRTSEDAFQTRYVVAKPMPASEVAAYLATEADAPARPGRVRRRA